MNHDNNDDADLHNLVFQRDYRIVPAFARTETGRSGCGSPGS